MTRSDLVTKLASSLDVSERDAGAVVSTVLETIGQALARGDRIELRGFGVLSVRQRDARKARHPRTGEAAQVMAKRKVHFKAGRQLNKSLNGDTDAVAILRDRHGQLHLL